MAFVAGVLLMSVPEEASWQLLVNLMAEETVGMRDLYRPGLTGLKRALRMFEWLLARLAPALKAHLEVCEAVNSRGCAQLASAGLIASCLAMACALSPWQSCAAKMQA